MTGDWTLTANIGEAGNTSYGFPLRLLAHRGFTVVLPPFDVNLEEAKEYWAIHPNGTRMIAGSPLALLGLLSILDHLGPDWYDNPEMDLSDAIDVIDLDPAVIAEVPDDELAHARRAFELLCRSTGKSIPAGNTREQLTTACREYLDVCRKEEEDAQRSP